MHGNRILTTILSLRHPSMIMIYQALITAGARIRHEHIRTTPRDPHGGRSLADECIILSPACVACRHYAINSNPHEPPTRQEARGVDASFKGVRVHSTNKGDEKGGKPLSREETTPLSIRAPYRRPPLRFSSAFVAISKLYKDAGAAGNTGGLYPTYA